MQAHSHSSLADYNTCAFKYYHTRILKSYKREQGVEATWGHAVHSAAESRIQSGDAFTMPKDMEVYGPPIDKISAALSKEHLFTEVPLAIDENYKAATWDDCRFRGKVDLLWCKPPLAVILDWKTGKIRDGVSQLEFYAMLTFLNFDNVNKIMGMLYWLKHRKVTVFTMHRQDVPTYAAKFTSWARNIETDTDWTQQPSGLCRRYCEVLCCPFNGRK